MRALTHETEPAKLYRAQGAAEVLGDLMVMPAEIRQYLHEVSTGKRHKLETGGPK